MSNKLVAQGNEILKAGDQLKARQLFISAIKQNPNDEEAWYGLYYAIDNNEQRIRCLKEILRINPTDDKARQILEQHQASDDFLNGLTQKLEQTPSMPPQPSIQTAACSSCGAPLNIPPDAEYIYCSYCGASLSIQRSDGSVALKLAEKVSQAIQDSGTETQAVIQEGTSVTRDELKQIQLRQDLSTAQLQFSNTRAEIRALERDKQTSKIVRQLRELHATEAELAKRIRILEETIDPTKKTVISAKAKKTGCGCSSLLAPFMKSKLIPIIVVISSLVVLCIICSVIVAVVSSTPSFKATQTAKAMSRLENVKPAYTQPPSDTLTAIGIPIITNTLEPSHTLNPTLTPKPTTTPTPIPIGLGRNNPYPSSEIVSAPNWDVQVLEVKRGVEAWEKIRAANVFNEAASEGMEYLLVKLHVKSTYTDADEHSISGCDFDVTGSHLIRYTCSMAMVVAPEPQLDARLFTGGEAEGWAAYLVAQGENNLILVVNETFNFDEGAIRYIALDEGATINISPELSNIKATDLGKERSKAAPRTDKIVTEDWEVSVIEVVRGDEAWKMVREANQFNDPPAEGMEYIVVQIHAHYIGTEDEAENIDVSFFKTTGSAGVLYELPSVVGPDPSLDISVYPDGEYNGWIVVQAAKDESGVVLVFDPLFDFSGKNTRYISLEP